MSTPPTSLALRPALETDNEFLFRVFCSTGAADVLRTGMSEDDALAFCSMQFHAQSRHYATWFPGYEQYVVTHHDEPVGRLYLHRSDDGIRVLDVAVLADRQGQGIGTTLLRRVLEEAAGAGIPVHLRVRRDNPRAQRLYERLGFLPRRDDGPDLLDAAMIWSPPSPGAGVRRRTFVAVSAVAALAGATGLVGTIAATEAAADDRPWTRSALSPHVGSRFGLPGGRALRLTRVTDLPTRPPGLSGAELARHREHSFALTFRQVAGAALPEDAVAVRHPAVGQTLMFLTPAGEHRGARVYQAVYNRLGV